VVWLAGTFVIRIRCDNAGETRFLQTITNAQCIKLIYEFTSPGTPQQNGRTERKFWVLYEYMRGMLNQASLPTKLRTTLWAEGSQ
jgi:hypothetical protein